MPRASWRVADRPLERPWHGASDRAAAPAVLALRLQRAEVDALLAFRHAAEGEAAVLAWWRLQRCRRARLALHEAAPLPPLPEPPQGALGWWQGMLRRLGQFRIEAAGPPARIARRLDQPRG
jgi:hypothetical protein